MIDLDSDDILLSFQIPHHFVHQLMHDHSVPAELGINKTEVRTLMTLRRKGAMTMHELGDRVGIAKGSLTSVVDKLISLELAERSGHPDDRRKVLVAISNAGLETAKQMDKHLRTHLDKKFSVLEQSEHAELLQSLKTIHTISKRLKDAK